MADIKPQYLWLIERMKKLKHGTMIIHIQDGVPVKTSKEESVADFTFQEYLKDIENEKDKK